MNEMNAVSIKVGGKSHGGWTQVNISRSLDRVAASFSLTVSERYPGEGQPLRIRGGDACEIFIGADLVLTGYVDSVNPSYDGQSHSISVAGRSKTQDLIDCSVAPPWGDVRSKTILEIADQLATPYGVDIVDNMGGKTEPIEMVRIGSDETVMTALKKLAAIKAVILTDDERGRLLMTRAGIERASSSLKLGDNILSGSGSFAVNDRFSDYQVVGQGNATDKTNGTAVSQPTATALDKGVERFRLTVVRLQGAINSKQAEDRARWETSSRIAKAVKLSYTVQGWRQANGDLWKINQMVSVDDDFLTVMGDMLITGVAYSIGSQGSICALTLSPRAAYELAPTVEPSGTDSIGLFKLDLDLS